MRILKKISNRSEIFFCFTIHKKLNKSCSLEKKLLLKKKFLSLKKTSFENFITVVRKGGFQFLWIMVLYNAALVVTFIKIVLGHTVEEQERKYLLVF